MYLCGSFLFNRWKSLPLAPGKWAFAVAIFFALSAISVASFNYIVDPYGIFQTKFIEGGYLSINDRYAKVEHLIRHPQQYDALILGSSMMGAYTPDLMRDISPSSHYYNLGYFGGTMREAHQTLLALGGRGIRPKELMIGVDYFTFHQQKDSDSPAIRPHPLVSGQKPMQYFSEYLFSPSLFHGLLRIKESTAPIKRIQFDIQNGGTFTLPLSEIEISTNKDRYIRTHFQHSGMPAAIEWRQQSFDDFKDLLSYLKKTGVKLHVFIHPCYVGPGSMVSSADVKRFVSAIKSIEPTAIDLSEIPEAINPENYYDLKHYRPHIARMVVAKIAEHEREPNGKN